MIAPKGKTLAENYTHVYEGDPAVPEGEDLPERIRKYLDTGDESNLNLQDEPSRFKLQHLQGLARAHLENMLATSEGDIPFGVLIDACRLALVDVENLEDEDGNAVRVERKKDKDLKCKAVTERTLDRLYELDEGIIPSIGYRVVTELFLSRSKKRA